MSFLDKFCRCLSYRNFIDVFPATLSDCKSSQHTNALVVIGFERNLEEAICVLAFLESAPMYFRPFFVIKWVSFFKSHLMASTNDAIFAIASPNESLPRILYLVSKHLHTLVSSKIA